MANKNTNMILAVAVIAVCAIAIIGVGYAYTATTQNAGNTVDVKYITLSQAAYDSSFDEKIEYDTENLAGTITYTAHNATALYEGGPNGVNLGSTTVTVGRSTGNTDNFQFSVSKLNTAGSTMDTSGFYIGIQVGTGTEVIRAFDVSNPNYYKEGTDHAAVTSNGSNITLADDLEIVVNMYYVPPTVTTPNVPNVQPLKDVTFEFKATAPDASD